MSERSAGYEQGYFKGYTDAATKHKPDYAFRDRIWKFMESFNLVRQQESEGDDTYKLTETAQALVDAGKLAAQEVESE